MENVWLTTDWHLYSKEWNDQHPHRSKANLERLATNFNSTIGEHDLLIHLGDICDPESADYETMKKIISSIPGRKILVRGNHDTEKDPYYIGLGFDDVVDVLVIHNMIFTHKPMQVAPDELNIHGHLHSEKLVSPTINGYRHINAFGANWNSIDLPILLEDLLDMASKQNIRLDPEEEKEIKSHFVKDLYGEDMRFSGKVLLDLTSEFVLAPMDEDATVADEGSWYYYISADNSLDHKVIRPTKPENVFGTALFEKVVSADTVRVPLYKTIDGAVRSLHRLNLSSLKDKVFYLYVCNTNQLQLPFISYVPDADLTGEVWATEPVIALFYSAIQIDDRAGDGYNCYYGENPDNPTEYTKKIYDWSYHDVTNEQKPPIQLALESASEDEMLSEILFTDTDSTKYWLADDRKFIEKASKGDAERKDTANVAIDEAATNEDTHIGYLVVHGMKLDIYRKETENPNDPVDSTAHDLAFYYGVTKIADISISAVNTDEAFLYNFEVDKKYRNHGIGSEILKYVLKQYKVNELTVEETNYNAIRLYKRFGFKEYTTFTENKRPMLDMRINVNLSEASRTKEYERTDDNHAMTSPEEKREVFQKYGINAVGDTHEAEKEEEEARKKREAEKKLKATQKRMKKARDAKKRKAFFRKVKSKLPKIRGVKNEDADTSDAEYLDRDYAGYETNALWGDRTQFFVDQYRYKDAALDESAILKELQSTNGLTLLDHVQFNDALNEASFLGDNKQIPIQDAKEIASVAMKQLKDLIKKHRFRALKPKLYEIYGRDIIIEVLGGDQDLRIQHSKEFEVLANELNQSEVLDPYRNLIQEIDAGDGDEGCVYIQLKHKVTENIPANEAVSYIGVREALTLVQETTHVTDLSEGVLFNRNVPTTSQHLTYRPLKPNEKLYPVYVVVMHTGSVVSTVIKKATGDLYSHASISFDPSLTNMYSFGNKRIKGKAFANGFKKEDIHNEFFSSRNIPYAMYMVPVTKEELVAMKKRLDYFVKNENKFSFDMIGLVKIFFGIADNPENRYFCSRFVMDVLNAGRPSDPYTQEESLVKPQDLAETNFARYVMGGYLKDYNPKTCAYLTKKLLAEEEVKRRKIKGVMGETVDTAVYDINYNNPWIDHVLRYQFTRMDESIVDPFIRYLQSFKVRIDANGDILVTRREYDQLNAHFKNSLKLIKAYENAGNLVGVKDELCKIYYMVELINTYYLRQDVKNLRDKAADVRKDMVDLRSIMLNAFAQHMRYVTTREPDWNFKTYYDASKYGNDFRIPKKFLLSLGKTIITALS